MATSNFQQHNPAQNNQLTDAAYTSDGTRTNGAASGVYPSNSFNKLAYQLSTFVAAFAQAMAGKGFTMSDANMATLATALGNVVTTADELGGTGQSYNDLTPSRAIGSTYTNSTGRPIMVMATLTVNTGSNTSLAIGGLTVQEFGNANVQPYTAPVTFIVPAGATYGLTNVVGANTLIKWIELG